MLDIGPHGHDFADARAPLAEAHKLLAHQAFDADTILALSRAALDAIRISHLLSAEPGRVFVDEQLEHVRQLADRLSEDQMPTQRCLATLLLAIDFLIQAAQLPHNGARGRAGP